jgi:DNA integrity scanning protein DisA with diadenylate cyclase activity
MHNHDFNIRQKPSLIFFLNILILKKYWFELINLIHDMDIVKRINRITSNKILKNIITWLSTYGVIIWFFFKLKKNNSDFFSSFIFFSCNFEGFYQANNLTLNFMHEQERTIFVFLLVFYCFKKNMCIYILCIPRVWRGFSFQKEERL